jgi:DNA-binding response OmpR family regulator
MMTATTDETDHDPTYPTSPLPGGIVDFHAREIRFRDGATCRLTPIEAELFRFLISHAVTPISRDALLRDVWRMDPSRVYTRTVDVHIGKLRRKLRDHPRSPQIIVSVHGLGYMLRL